MLLHLQSIEEEFLQERLPTLLDRVKVRINIATLEFVVNSCL